LLGWILAWARFYAYLHDVTSPKGLQVNLEQDCQVSELSSYRAVLNSPDQSAKCSISSVKQRALFTRSEGLDYRRRPVSEDRRSAAQEPSDEQIMYLLDESGAIFVATSTSNNVAVVTNASRDGDERF
jgi:hypothetical protein